MQNINWTFFHEIHIANPGCHRLFYCAKIFTCTVKQLLLRVFLLNKECLICSWSKSQGIYPSNTTALRKPGSFIEDLFTKAGWSGSGIWPCGMPVWTGPRMYRSADQDWCVMDPRGGGAPMSTYTLSLPTKTVVAPNSIPLNPESCCSPKLKLLFSYCERLFHLDLAAVMDHDVLERFISPICLCALNLSHHILEDSRTISTVTGVNALLGVWRNR